MGHLGYKFSERTAAVAPRTATLLPEETNPAYVLPRMVISERPLKLLERDLLTERGRKELAEKRYLTPMYRTTFGPAAQLASYYFNPLGLLGGWHPNTEEAMTLYREEERVQTLQEIDDLVELESLGKDGAAKDLKELHAQVRQTGVNALYWNPSVLLRK